MEQTSQMLKFGQSAESFEQIHRHGFDSELYAKRPQFINIRSRSYDNLLWRNEYNPYYASSMGVTSPLSDVFPLTDSSYRPPSYLRPLLCENCGKLLQSRMSSRRRSSVELMLSPPDAPSSPRFVTVAYSPQLQVSRNYFDLWSSEDQERIECLIEAKSCTETLSEVEKLGGESGVHKDSFLSSRYTNVKDQVFNDKSDTIATNFDEITGQENLSIVDKENDNITLFNKCEPPDNQSGTAGKILKTESGIEDNSVFGAADLDTIGVEPIRDSLDKLDNSKVAPGHQDPVMDSPLCDGLVLDTETKRSGMFESDISLDRIDKCKPSSILGEHNPVTDSLVCDAPNEQLPETIYESDISTVASSLSGDDMDIGGFFEECPRSVLYNERVTVNVIVDVSNSDDGNERPPQRRQKHKERVEVNLVLDLQNSCESLGSEASDDMEMDNLPQVISTKDGIFNEEDLSEETPTGDVKVLKPLESMPLFYQEESNLQSTFKVESPLFTPAVFATQVSSQYIPVNTSFFFSQVPSVDSTGSNQPPPVRQVREDRIDQPRVPRVEEDIIQTFTEAVQNLPSTDFFEFFEEDSKLIDNTPESTLESIDNTPSVVSTDITSHLPSFDEDSRPIPFGKHTRETAMTLMQRNSFPGELDKPKIGTIVYTETSEMDSDSTPSIPVDIPTVEKEENVDMAPLYLASSTEDLLLEDSSVFYGILRNHAKESEIALDPGTASTEFTPNRKKIVIEDNILGVEKQPEFQEIQDSLAGEQSCKPGCTQIFEDQELWNQDETVPDLRHDIIIVRIKSHYLKLGPLVSAITTRFSDLTY